MIPYPPKFRSGQVMDITKRLSLKIIVPAGEFAVFSHERDPNRTTPLQRHTDVLADDFIRQLEAIHFSREEIDCAISAVLSEA